MSVSFILFSGLIGQSLVISECVVYVLDNGSNLYMRCGICEQNVMGDYWKKIPGQFKRISGNNKLGRYILFYALIYIILFKYFYFVDFLFQ